MKTLLFMLAFLQLNIASAYEERPEYTDSRVGCYRSDDGNYVIRLEMYTRDGWVHETLERYVRSHECSYKVERYRRNIPFSNRN